MRQHKVSAAIRQTSILHLVCPKNTFLLSPWLFHALLTSTENSLSNDRKRPTSSRTFNYTYQLRNSFTYCGTGGSSNSIYSAVWSTSSRFSSSTSMSSYLSLYTAQYYCIQSEKLNFRYWQSDTIWMCLITEMWSIFWSSFFLGYSHTSISDCIEIQRNRHGFQSSPQNNISLSSSTLINFLSASLTQSWHTWLSSVDNTGRRWQYCCRHNVYVRNRKTRVVNPTNFLYVVKESHTRTQTRHWLLTPVTIRKHVWWRTGRVTWTQHSFRPLLRDVARASKNSYQSMTDPDRIVIVSLLDKFDLSFESQVVKNSYYSHRSSDAPWCSLS